MLKTLISAVALASLANASASDRQQDVEALQYLGAEYALGFHFGESDRMIATTHRDLSKRGVARIGPDGVEVLAWLEGDMLRFMGENYDQENQFDESTRRDAAVFAMSAALAHAETPRCTGNEQALLTQERDVAMVLAREGFDAYEALFAPDFTLWIDGRSLSRDEFLSGVKNWYEAGHRATATAQNDADAEFFGDLALARYEIRENFNDGTIFRGRIVSLERCVDGNWRLFRSHVTTLYRGAAEAAEN